MPYIEVLPDNRRTSKQMMRYFWGKLFVYKISMQQKTFRFTHASTDCYFAAGFAQLKKLVNPASAVLVTDENIFSAHTEKFTNWNTIVLKPGEEYKVQATVDSVTGQLINMKADRQTTLVGVGGGVTTDITGYVASVYMRGIAFGFVPTTLLALVDASIGGKNGIDVGVYKNMVGTIRQPRFILHDYTFLSTLPEKEWKNGFAEMIKHAAIKDATMFRQLEDNNLPFYQRKKTALAELIKRNALIKIKLVQADEFETGNRKLLNFGHTLGHAIENSHRLMHGEAVTIGMAFAAKLSVHYGHFKHTARLTKLIEQYGLPISADYDKGKVFEVLQIDKKGEAGAMNFVLLQKIGKAFVQKIPLKEINNLL
jgi:3-dehydroquinate synthase